MRNGSTLHLRPAVSTDIDGVAGFLRGLSQRSPDGAVAVDARVRVGRPARRPPYPAIGR
jgi:hypothetical protein